MVLPILISVAVTPGVSCARTGPAMAIATLAAIAAILENVDPGNMFPFLGVS